ncbi:type VI secretion system Vgr family protein [Segnochrobactrum spirostomi]|uniref:type VI secretion system Vgr family protein n=1 Tax=Segnochrobactrum spirostomi TaxID=2608987 RepID=UPI001AD82D3E|nr:type VI secretion system tip protein TssI/VgrG [Segnochrobactrum spirostomi]
MLTLEASSLEGKEVLVTSIEGEERISDLFRYEIVFTSVDLIDPEDVIGKTATLTVETGGHTLTTHGILVEFTEGELTASGDQVYRTVLAPQLALLDLSRQNLIYGAEEAIKLNDLIDTVLTNKAGRNSTSGGHGLSIDHERRLRIHYPSRKQVVQYGESDLTFLRRQCEYEGVFFFFEHGDDKETVVFGDKNDVFKEVEIDGGQSLVFNDKRSGARPSDLAMTRFRAVTRPVPGTLYLRDYNETKTSPPLKVSETVTDQGFGKVVEYGDHFDDEEQGKKLAKIRAEEIGCRRTIYVGDCNAPQLRAGMVFTLREHPRASLSDQFLVISAHHAASIALPSAFGAGATAAHGYTNQIECIKLSTPFRPERKTPKPNVSGLYTAQIDAEQDRGKRGWMDDRGRYRVRFAFDDGDAQAGKASDYIRQSQPYLGPDATGFHFPLLQGTEVVVGYLNGDPDRPIVVGAVSNEKNADPVTKHHNTLNRIVTPANVMMEIDDRAAPPDKGSSEDGSSDAPFFRIDTPSKVAGRSFTGSYLRMGQPIPKDERSLLPKATRASVDAQTQDDPEQAAENALTTGVLLYTHKDLNVNVAGTATYNYGEGYATETLSGSSTHKVDDGEYTLYASDDIDMTTDSDINLSAYDMTVKLTGSSDITVDGTSTTTVSGETREYYLSDVKTTNLSKSQNLMWGDTTLLTMAATFSMKLSIELAIVAGLQTKICLGGELKFASPQDFKAVLGYNITLVAGYTISLIQGKEYKTRQQVIDATNKFTANYLTFTSTSNNSTETVNGAKTVTSTTKSETAGSKTDRSASEASSIELVSMNHKVQNTTSSLVSIG